MGVMVMVMVMVMGGGDIRTAWELPLQLLAKQIQVF